MKYMMSPNAIKPIPYKANIPVEINRNNQIAIAMIIGNGYNFIFHGKNVLPFLFLNNINLYHVYIQFFGDKLTTIFFPK